MSAEKLVTLEIAKGLKELGFDWEVYKYFLEMEIVFNFRNYLYNFNDRTSFDARSSAPTLSHAAQYFREVHDIYISILFELGDFETYIDFDKTSGSHGLEETYITHDEALTAGLLYVIKIVKERTNKK